MTNLPEVWTHEKVSVCTPPVDHQSCTTPGLALRSDGQVLAAYAGPRTPHGQQPGTCRIYAREFSVGTGVWGPEREMIHHPECQAVGPAFLRAGDGVLWCIYLAFYEHYWPDGEPDMARSRADLWAAKSVDDGKTWTNHQMIFRGYTGATNSAIESAAGNFVVPFSYVVPSPGRLVSACLISTDRGQTWQLGQSIDIGQCGDHSGALEPSIGQLRDGRIWMLIRTNLGQFWEAFSDNDGFSFTAPVPTTIGSPSAPCHLCRLQSGRLALAWNNTMHRQPEKEAGPAGRVDGASLNQSLRDTLSLALSEDEGKSWTTPLDIARSVQLSYPLILETSPGRLLISCQTRQVRRGAIDYIIGYAARLAAIRPYQVVSEQFGGAGKRTQTGTRCPGLHPLNVEKRRMKQSVNARGQNGCLPPMPRHNRRGHFKGIRLCGPLPATVYRSESS